MTRNVWTHVFAFCLVVVIVSSETDMSRLRKRLLQNYDKNIRPVLIDNATTVVRMAFHIRHLLQLDEKIETLSAEGIIRMDWQDQHLVWNPKEYGNLTVINLGDHEVWQPDVYLFHSSGQNYVDDDRSTFVRITSQGNVSWVPAASLQVPCIVSYTYYPFEKHWCEFQFGSWTHNGDDLLLLPYADFTIKPSDVSGGEWRITEWSYTAREYYVAKVNPYNSINLTVAIQRVSSLHKITSVVPVVTSSIMALAGFWLDLWSTPRYVLGIGNFAMIALQLLHLGTTLPAGRDIPLLAQFSATAVCMATLFLVLTVALDSTQRRRGAPAEALVRFCMRLPESALCLQQDASQSELGTPREDANKAARDWLLVCRVIDRIAFWIFSIVYVVITSLLLSVA